MPLSTLMSAMTPSGSTSTLVPSSSSTQPGGSTSGFNSSVNLSSAAGSSIPAHASLSNGVGASVGGGIGNAGAGSNPVSALIAGRATVVAPPSLSAVNHIDTPAGNRTRERIQRLAGRTSQLSVRPDLQQNVSPPTAAMPIYTRENISTSQGWSIPPSSSSLPHKPPVLAGMEPSEELTVHSSFREDADQRGDVLVRVEGVEFFVHKHVLMFSSPFFASLLEGEWKESQLAARIVGTESSLSSSEGHDDCNGGQAPYALRESVDPDDEVEELIDDDEDEDSDISTDAGSEDYGEADAQRQAAETAAAVKTSLDVSPAWSSQRPDLELETRADHDDQGHDAHLAVVSPLSEESHAEDAFDEYGAAKATARSSTVRASFYTAEYHFEDAAEEQLDAGVGDTEAREEAVLPSEESRQNRINDAQRALEGGSTRSEFSAELKKTHEVDSERNSKTRPSEAARLAHPLPMEPGPDNGVLSGVPGASSPQSESLRKSRRRSASLDSSHHDTKAKGAARNHRPKARSIALQRKASRKLGDDPASRSIPTRKSSKSFDLTALTQTGAAASAAAEERQHDSEPASPLARFESLATPPRSPVSRPSTSSAATTCVPSNMAAGLESSATHTRSRSAVDAAPHYVRPTRREASETRSRRRSQRKDGGSKLVAVVDLGEESATTFQSFLFHIYPHLDLHVTWYNCEPLLRFADKFQVPYMRRSCILFLKTALPGRPIEAMRIAEQHQLAEQYKEASRHVLDNYSEWYPEELERLSKETLLKLERKRTWFLERMLKLGLCSPARDYECHAHCPDPSGCARALQDKWQTAYANTFRFSPPQPSAIFRHLRELDGAPFLAMSACQNTARAWVRLLFDRMFSLDTLHTPRQFLFVRLDTQPPKAGAAKKEP